MEFLLEIPTRRTHRGLPGLLPHDHTRIFAIPNNKNDTNPAEDKKKDETEKEKIGMQAASPLRDNHALGVSSQTEGLYKGRVQCWNGL